MAFTQEAIVQNRLNALKLIDAAIRETGNVIRTSTIAQLQSKQNAAAQRLKSEMFATRLAVQREQTEATLQFRLATLAFRARGKAVPFKLKTNAFSDFIKKDFKDRLIGTNVATLKNDPKIRSAFVKNVLVPELGKIPGDISNIGEVVRIFDEFKEDIDIRDIGVMSGISRILPFAPTLSARITERLKEIAEDPEKIRREALVQEALKAKKREERPGFFDILGRFKEFKRGDLEKRLERINVTSPSQLTDADFQDLAFTLKNKNLRIKVQNILNKLTPETIKFLEQRREKIITGQERFEKLQKITEEEKEQERKGVFKRGVAGEKIFPPLKKGPLTIKEQLAEEAIRLKIPETILRKP